MLHGPSGVGKSSILEAGAEPALRQLSVDSRNVFPVSIRTYKDWAVDLGKNLGKAMEEIGFKIPKLPDTPDTLVTVLKQNADENQRNLLTVIVFDQFEEFFFAHHSFENRETFYLFLKACLDIPYVKIILSLREDYLHHLLDISGLNIIEHDILGKKIRYCLGNFSPENARQMIQDMTANSGTPLEPALINKVVEDLSENSKGVRPIELQIVGYQLQAQKIYTLDKYVSKASLIEGFLDEIIGDFSKEYLTGDCGKENEEAALLILYLLTDSRNTRPEIVSELKNYEISFDDKQIDLILEILDGANLLFLVPGNPERYQIVHDYLVKLIRQRAERLLPILDERRNEKELQERIREEQEKKREDQERTEREKQEKMLRISVAVGFLFAVLAMGQGGLQLRRQMQKKILQNMQISLKNLKPNLKSQKMKRFYLVKKQKKPKIRLFTILHWDLKKKRRFLLIVP